LEIFKKETLAGIEYLVDNGIQRYRIDGNGTRQEALDQVLEHLGGVTA
jgi:hypothetical protein